MNKLTPTLLTLALAAGAAAPPLALAASDDARSIEEIVVTARQREETAQSVPIPITALTSGQMETRSIRDVTEIERLSPNTDISSSSVNSSAAQVFIRGIGQVNWSSTQDPKIGIYVDGVYLGRPQGALVDMLDLQRVEVLRGPQGTLFGRNTTAGLVHLITNAPDPEDQLLDLRAGLGSDGYQTGGIVYNQPIADSWAMRFAAYHKASDGFMENRLTGMDRGNEDATSFRFSLAGGAGLWDMRFSYDVFDADERAALGSCRWTGPDDGSTIPSAYLPRSAYDLGIYDQLRANCESTTQTVSMDTAPDESVTSQVSHAILTQNFDLDWGVVTAISSYREIDNFNGTWGWMMGNGPGANLLEVLENEAEHEVFSQEVRLAGTRDRLTWVVGLYYFQEDSVEHTDVPLFRGVPMAPADETALAHFNTPVPEDERGVFPAMIPLPDGMGGTVLAPLTYGLRANLIRGGGSRTQTYDATNKNQAIFAEVTYSITDDLDLTAGFRYTEDDREFTRIQRLYDGTFDTMYDCPGNRPGNSPTNPVLAISDRCTRQVEYDEVTPRVILSYQLTDDVMLYGSYSVGYSSGGFNQDVRMRTFLPETSDNIEFGVKSLAYGGKLLLNATLFYNIYENQQITVGRIVGGQPTADLINAQEAAISGVEFELQAQLSETFRVVATGGYVRGVYKEFLTEDNLFAPHPETGVLEERLVPVDFVDLGVEFGNNGSEFSFDFAFQQDLEVGGGRLAWTTGFSFKDAIYYTLRNIPASKAPSYWLVDARVSYSLPNGRTHFSLWSTNLLDEDHIENMISQSGTLQVEAQDGPRRDYSLGMTTDYWGDPRRIGIDFRHVF